jgi:DNA-binding transcriptional LysR family regulator
VACEPFILLTVDEAEQSAMRYWEQAGQRPSVRVRTSSVEAVRSMVANGSGVAILSDLVHRPWSLEGKRIETLTISDPVTPMSVGLAWHRNGNSARRCRRCVTTFTMHFWRRSSVRGVDPALQAWPRVQAREETNPHLEPNVRAATPS